jgi:Rrf2 family protein
MYVVVRFNSRLSASLHALMHLAERDEPMTSETLAVSLQTNPVVVRQTMAGLREAGIVRSVRGHGGGWSLARDLATVTARDVYIALGRPSLFLVGARSENPECVVEQAVDAALTAAFDDAETLILRRLSEISLATLTEQFRKYVAVRDERVANP